MSTQARRIQILRQMEQGEISFEEASRLLNQSEEAQTASTVDPDQPARMDNEEFERAIRYWKQWWMIPLWIAVGLAIAGAFLIYRTLVSGGLGFWFFCAWIPFLLGVGGIALAWYSQSARWVHVRVTQAAGSWPLRKIAVSLPLPLGLAGWFFRSFGPWIPSVRDLHLEDWFQVLEQSVNHDQPLYVEVNEKENGERVEVYIG